MNFYAVKNVADGHEVQEELADAWASIDHARDLWGLVDPARATALREFQNTAGGDGDDFRMVPRETDQLIRLIDGVERAITEQLLDDKQRLPAARLVEVRQKAPSLPLAEAAPADQVYAAQNALAGIDVLMNFLRRAREHGWDIVAG